MLKIKIIIVVVCYASIFYGIELKNVHIRSSTTVDLSDLQSIVRDVIKPEMTNRQKAVKLYHFLRTHAYSRHYPTEFCHRAFGNATEYPIALLNIYPWGQCETWHNLAADVFSAAGFKCRKRIFMDLGGHFFVEVYYDGKWHYIDPSQGFYFCLRDGKTIASVEDLRKDPTLITKPVSKEGFLWDISDSALEKYAEQICGKIIISKRGSDADGIHMPEKKCHSMKINLYTGDTYMLSSDKLGPKGIWYYPPKIPASVFKEINKKNKQRNITLPDIGPYPWTDREVNKNWKYAGFANGFLEFRPQIDCDGKVSRLLNTSMLDISNTGPLTFSVKAGTGSAVWFFSVPFVPVEGEVCFEKEPGGSVDIFISVNNGKEWVKVASANAEEQGKCGFKLREFILGAYQYQIKMTLTGKTAVRCLFFRTIFQMSPAAVPGLASGKNVITFITENPDALKQAHASIEYRWEEKTDHKTVNKKMQKSLTGSPQSFEIDCQGSEVKNNQIIISIK